MIKRLIIIFDSLIVREKLLEIYGFNDDAFLKQLQRKYTSIFINDKNEAFLHKKDFSEVDFQFEDFFTYNLDDVLDWMNSGNKLNESQLEFLKSISQV